MGVDRVDLWSKGVGGSNRGGGGGRRRVESRIFTGVGTSLSLRARVRKLKRDELSPEGGGKCKG